MQKIKFSVITITYNAQAVLEPTIQSVLSQYYPDIEYIIVDGASSDGTMDIVNRYKDKIAKVISEKDNGLYDAMNKGIKAATGDYLWFMNAGDAFHSAQTISSVVEKIRLASNQNLPDIIYGETAVIDSQRRFKAMRRLKTPASLSWRSFRMGMLVCHQSFVVKKAIAPLYDLSYRYSADFDWCINSMKRAEWIFNSQQTLADYLDEGLTTNNRSASLKERKNIMVKNYGFVTVMLLHLWFAVRFAFAKITGKE